MVDAEKGLIISQQLLIESWKPKIDWIEKITPVCIFEDGCLRIYQNKALLIEMFIDDSNNLVYNGIYDTGKQQYRIFNPQFIQDPVDKTILIKWNPQNHGLLSQVRLLSSISYESVDTAVLLMDFYCDSCIYYPLFNMPKINDVLLEAISYFSNSLNEEIIQLSDG